MCLSSRAAVTIVVDEANIAFNVDPGADKGDIDETRSALQYFTRFTKQRNEVRGMRLNVLGHDFTPFIYTVNNVRRQGNVILVSSEHAFPFGLTRQPIGFKLENFSEFLYGAYLSHACTYAL
jgi:hypothetical protein